MKLCNELSQNIFPLHRDLWNALTVPHSYLVVLGDLPEKMQPFDR